MKVFFVGDTSNRLNWGCRATTGMLRRMIGRYAEISATVDVSHPAAKPASQIISREIKGGRPARWSAGLKSSSHPFTVGLGRRITQASPKMLERYPWLLGYAVSQDFEKLADEIYQRKVFPAIAQAFSMSDAVVINGEGSFLKNRVQARIKFLLAYTAETRFNKPCAIVNHSADVRNPLLHEIAAKVYPVVSDILFREPFSLRETGPLAGDTRMGFAADTVFAYQPLTRDLFVSVASRPDYFSIFPEYAAPFDPAQPYICVGGSAAFYAERNEGFDARMAFASLCRGLQKLAPVVLTASSKPDDEILRPVARELNLPFFGLRTPVQQAVDLLGNAALYVGGRWHPAIMALTGGTPTVSLSSNTDYKASGLLELMGLDQKPVSVFDLGAHEDFLVRLAADYLKSGDSLRQQLLYRAAQMSLSAYDNVRILSSNSILRASA